MTSSNLSFLSSKDTGNSEVKRSYVMELLMVLGKSKLPLLCHTRTIRT